jgi:hypothetical protein
MALATMLRPRFRHSNSVQRRSMAHWRAAVLDTVALAEV